MNWLVAWRRIAGCLAGVCVAMVWVDAAESRVINLNGVIDLTYRWSRLEQSTANNRLTPTDTSGFLQHYQLGSTGDLGNPNLGTYTLNASLLDDTSRTNSVQTTDLTVKDYYFSMNLLPRMTPVNFYAQRITQDNDALVRDTLGTKSTTTTFSVTWDIPLQRLPRLRVNVFQSELQVDSTVVSNMQTRAAAVDADGQAGATRYFARYQWTELGNETTSTTSNTVTASAETVITSALSTAVRANYSSNVTTLGVVTPGLSTLLQRSAGASVFYRPSLQTTLNASYDFYKDPFDRHLFAANAALRPLTNVDVAAGYRFFRFDVEQNVTDSNYAFASVNYRPILGLSTNASASLGATDVSGLTPVHSIYQNYGYGMTYFKTLTLVTYRLGYQGGYNENHASAAVGSSRSASNVFSAGLSNNDVRLVALSADYTLALVRQETSESISTDQRDHRVQVTANSTAPRDLLLLGDYLALTGLASYSLDEYRTFTNHETVLSTTETYETGRGVSTSVGYTFTRQSQTNYDNQTTAFIQVRWFLYVVRNATLDLNARQSWERYQHFQPDIDRSEGGALLTYQLGRITLSADLRVTREINGTSRLLNQVAFARVARPF